MSANPTHATRFGRHPMEWQRTAGGLIDAGAVVHACCSTCGLWKVVDMRRVPRRVVMWGRLQRCPNGCGPKAVFFHAGLPGTPSRPLKP